MEKPANPETKKRKAAIRSVQPGAAARRNRPVTLAPVKLPSEK